MFNIHKLFVSMLGVGFISFAPGTISSLIAVVFFYLVINYLSFTVILISFITIFIFSLISIKKYELQNKSYDTSEVVIDEFLGIMLIILFYDNFKFANDELMMLIIFILFRFFDIFKFYPANWIDKNIKNSFGVLLDDLVAALYSIICLIFINAII